MNCKVAFPVLRVPAGAARSSVHLKEDPKRHGSDDILRVVNAKLAKDDLTLVAFRVITPKR